MPPLRRKIPTRIASPRRDLAIRPYQGSSGAYPEKMIKSGRTDRVERSEDPTFIDCGEINCTLTSLCLGRLGEVEPQTGRAKRERSGDPTTIDRGERASTIASSRLVRLQEAQSELFPVEVHTGYFAGYVPIVKLTSWYLCAVHLDVFPCDRRLGARLAESHTGLFRNA